MSSYNPRRQGVRDGQDGKDPYQHKNEWNQRIYMEVYAQGHQEYHDRMLEVVKKTDLELMTEQRDELLEALRLAVTLVNDDVIRVRDSERETLLDALSSWNCAIAKATNA